ncbi:unnamed protein product [Macrosiphum euphorbiae]|uniref:Uncharacterized protein n=1 Tax=Macrosiphum euphorbiae TaxID=13131 RepID=A0AAV0W6Z2_9HEMI|nr:unnamed protein product [Macrosiphum euphorbiae]
MLLISNNIVEHWLELKTHFSLVVKKEKCYVARVLNEMLNDDVNYLYLLIIKPILYEVKKFCRYWKILEHCVVRRYEFEQYSVP